MNRTTPIMFCTLAINSFAAAAPLTITNHSFESPALAPGSFMQAPPTGWTGSGAVGVQYPGSAAFPNGVSDGNQCAYVNPQGLLAITLEAVLEPETEYVLRVDHAERADFSFAGAAVTLFAGTTTLATALRPSAFGPGEFGEMLLSYTAPADHPAIGMPLTIHLETLNNGVQTNFDNVRLDAYGAPACPPLEQATIRHYDPSNNASFGRVADMVGNTAVIGVPFDESAGASAGVVQVLEWTGAAWKLDSELIASDSAGGQHFGEAVALSPNGQRIIVGAPGADTPFASGAGAAYVFGRGSNGWIEEAKLFASGGASDDGFGESVSIDDTSAIIGAPYRDAVGDAAGSAYIFEYVGAWAHAATLSASDGGPFEFFGLAVAIRGDRAAVGAPENEGGGPNAGAVYTFRRNTSWTATQKLLPIGGQAEGEMGRVLAMSEDRIVAGAGRTPTPEDLGFLGAAYVFRLDAGAWVDEARLDARGGTFGDEFGRSVDITGDLIAVGADTFDAGLGAERGAAFLYRREGLAWSHVARVDPPTLANQTYFGSAVAVAPPYLLVGAENDSDACNAFNGAGSATFFRLFGEAMITRHPMNTDACAGSSATLSVVAQSDSALTHQWRRDGVDLADGPLSSGEQVIGSQSHSLIISGLTVDAAGVYDCIVTSLCGEVISAPALLTVSAGGTCPGDANSDGEVAFSDITFILTNWGAMCP